MFGSVKKLFANRKGAFAVQFALLAVPLTVCTGLAIDGGRAFLAHYELASALDAAALAVGSTTDEDADLDAVAQMFVDKNFHTPHDGPIVLTLTPTDDTITLHGTVTINTYFMPLVGQPHVTVSAESEVKRGGSNVEVALALDVTESMAGSKITALKQAAKDLVAEVVKDVQTPYFSKVAIAPWGTNIHLGTYADAVRGPVQGAVNISGAHWRDGTSKNIAANSGWRVGGVGYTITGASWKNGSAQTVHTISKVSSRILVRTTANHGYSNGDTVYISGITNGAFGTTASPFTTMNGGIYKVANRTTSSPYTFNIQYVGTTTYVTPPNGSPTASTTGSVQRCLDTECDVHITTSAAHGLVANDRVRITGVVASTGTTGSTSMVYLNNTADQSWQVEAAPTTTTFTLETLNGPAITNNWSSGGTASECWNTSCQYVINATSHGFAAGDYVNISGASHVSGSTGTSLNTGNSSTFTIASTTTNAFILPGSGYNYRDWSSSGTVSECFLSNCMVRITTSAAHGRAAGDSVQILSVGGSTGVNNSGTDVWTIGSIIDSTKFTLSGTDAGLSNMSSGYTSGTGQVWCVVQGCSKYRYLTASSGTYAIDSISNCATERTGAHAHSEAPPTTAYVGRDYPGGDSLVQCNTNNSITPLTSVKSALNTAIDNMVVTGSTAGQIGTEWGWYMLSPDWGYLWPAESNRPKAYGTKELAKVMVLMTDGEFNTAHCNGVTTEAYAYSSVPNSDRIDDSVCTAANTPFNLAQLTCTEIKKKNITIYTVGFQLNLALSGDEFLSQCATTPQHAYLAATAAQLQEAFKDIATEISKLRISR